MPIKYKIKCVTCGKVGAHVYGTDYIRTDYHKCPFCGSVQYDILERKQLSNREYGKEMA